MDGVIEEGGEGGAAALEDGGAPGVGVVELAGGVGLRKDVAEAEVPGAEAFDLKVFVVVQGHLPVPGEVVTTLNRAVVEWARLGVPGLELLAGGGVGQG